MYVVAAVIVMKWMCRCLAAYVTQARIYKHGQRVAALHGHSDGAEQVARDDGAGLRPSSVGTSHVADESRESGVEVRAMTD